MTKQQIKWAASHDWFFMETSDGQGVLVKDRGNTRIFDDIKKLREWAGY